MNYQKLNHHQRDLKNLPDFDFVPDANDSALDADMAAAMAKQEELQRHAGGSTLTLEDNRRQQAQLAGFWSEGSPDIAYVDDVEIPSSGGTVAARLYRPTRQNTPVLIYLHGGGWCRGSIASDAGTCRHLAEKSGFAVLSLEYRLAPENPYPAALSDVLAAMQWCRKSAATWNLDAERVFLGGGSAGANLSLAAALKCRDDGLPGPSGLALFYGWFQCTDFDTPSHRAFGDGRYGNSTQRLLGYAAHYVANGAQPYDPYISPLRAASLAGLPPMWLGVAELDALRDEQLALAERVTAEGGQALVRRYYGLVHGFGGRTRMVPRAVAAITDAGEFIKSTATPTMSRETVR
ncbi:alpha/beta hydrolase [Rhizobium calliandrae]|uniref:Alpha/beta hydrolase n=2 Tax=Rhizobium calliandrae TaxID=1312182 RepID=A0ABT7KME0_9HYPH|nr:alpha/beta hydrolase [Rhizobium calliandrae]